MLTVNLKRVFALRGVERPAAFMLKHGINRQTANNLLNQQTSVVKIEHIEMLCRLLNCTPNDLFEWDDTANSLPATHSLNDLKRTMSAKNILQTAKDIPLGEVERLIDERKTQK